MRLTKQPTRSAYAIFTDTICQGTIVAWHDDNDYPEIYPSELEAQREIADDLIERLRQFMEGERDFDDAITIEDYILPVEVWPDGSVTTKDGRRFYKRV